jgi:hypothetical protein
MRLLLTKYDHTVQTIIIVPLTISPLCLLLVVRLKSHLKSKCGNILAKTATLRSILNIDGVSVASRSHTHPSHPLSFINFVSMFRCSSPSWNPVYARHVDPSTLAFSLSSHRHSYISLLFSCRFITSYNLIGKLTAFLHLQEFSLHNQIVVSSTTTVSRPPHNSTPRFVTFSPRLQYYGLS